MILVKGKHFNRQEAGTELIALKKELKDAQDEAEEAQQEVCEKEGEVEEIEEQIKDIEGQLKSEDLTQMLPTPLFIRGFKLTEVEIQSPSLTLRRTILENSDGEAVKEWEVDPSLAELNEVMV